MLVVVHDDDDDGIQVCGSDHVTYENECRLKSSNCENRRNVTVLHQGPCSQYIDTHHANGVFHDRMESAVPTTFLESVLRKNANILVNKMTISRAITSAMAMIRQNCY